MLQGRLSRPQLQVQILCPRASWGISDSAPAKLDIALSLSNDIFCL